MATKTEKPSAAPAASASATLPPALQSSARAADEKALSKEDLKSAAVDLVDSPDFFTDDKDYKAPSGVIVKSLSPLLKPDQFPVGKVLVGVFTKMFPTTPTAGKIGCGIEIVPPRAPVGIALPAVATLITGLEISGADTKSPTSPHLGCVVAIKKMPNKLPSKKGQDAWNFVVLIYPKVAETAQPALK